MRRSNQFLDERKKCILDLINSEGKVSVERICKEFSISPSTVRTLLNTLDMQGLIVRKHGGAQSINFGENNDERENNYLKLDFYVSNLREKAAIAREAVKFVEEGDIIAVTGGSTTYIFAKELKKKKNITVATNSVLVATELLSNTSIDVRMCGGILQHGKGSLSSMYAEVFFSDIHATKMFIGADSVSVDDGITSGNANISKLEKTIAKHSDKVIVLADHTKFECRPTVDRVLTPSEIDMLIVDANLPTKYQKKIQSKGIKISLV